MGITVTKKEKKKKGGGRATSSADIPLEDLPNNKLPPTKGDTPFEKFMRDTPSTPKMSPKKRKQLDKLIKQFDEDVGRFEGHKAGKKMATDEFSQSMKKPGAVDTYAGQVFAKDRSKRVKEKKLNDAIEKGIIEDIKKGKTPFRKAAKGGYIKKYAKGGGVRKVRS